MGFGRIDVRGRPDRVLNTLVAAGGGRRSLKKASTSTSHGLALIRFFDTIKRFMVPVLGSNPMKDGFIHVPAGLIGNGISLNFDCESCVVRR